MVLAMKAEGTKKIGRLATKAEDMKIQFRLSGVMFCPAVCRVRFAFKFEHWMMSLENLWAVFNFDVH